MRIAGIALLSTCTAVACASAPEARPATPEATRAMSESPRSTRVSRIVVTPEGTTSIDELFAHAEAKVRQGDAAAAAEAFDRVVELEPNGPRAAEALLGASTAHETASDLGAAVARLEQLARRFPQHDLARPALVGAVRIHATRDAWQRAGETAELLMDRYPDLAPIEQVVARGGRAVALIEAGDLDRAQYHVEKGRTVVERHRLDAAGRLPRELASLYFALGEIRRIRAERIRFVPVPPDFAAELERRCQLILDAQSAYSDAMRAYDPHWSAKAGFRVGELYQKLHADLMQVPPPASADTARRQQLFEGAMRLRYSILLEKALAMMQHTLAMCARTGEGSGWVGRVEQAKRTIERSIRDEQAAIDRLPYSRAELQAALDRLATGKSRTSAAGPAPLDR